MYYTKFDTRFCEMIVVGDEDGITNLHMNTGEGNRSFQIQSEWIENYAFFEEAIDQIQAYMEGGRKDFDLKLNPKGTDYQKNVWKALVDIPFGETATYKDVAVKIGNPKASRAVGTANGKNPIPLIVPCHRVIGSNGKLTGFAHGTAVKEKMINHELMIQVFDRMLERYGHLDWWPAGSIYEMMVGAVLTQNTAWSNVAIAIENFGDRLTPEFVRDADDDLLIDIIRPAGFFTQKAGTLKRLTAWYERYDFDIEEAAKKTRDEIRQDLLAINGIGRETADCILLYALKKPSFVIDAYTRRLFDRIGMTVPENYDAFKKLFEDALPEDVDIYNEYHALIVENGKQHCNKKPICDGCPLRTICHYGSNIEMVI